MLNISDSGLFNLQPKVAKMCRLLDWVLSKTFLFHHLVSLVQDNFLPLSYPHPPPPPTHLAQKQFGRRAPILCTLLDPFHRQGLPCLNTRISGQASDRSFPPPGNPTPTFPPHIRFVFSAANLQTNSGFFLDFHINLQLKDSSHL